VIRLTLEQIAEVVGGTLLSPDDAGRVATAVTIDSRTAGQGSLFVPLPGTHADGHAFIPDAAARGAAGYLLAEDHDEPGEPGAVVVDDPGDALLGLGAWVRDAVDPVVVAITGSNGKTTTKDLVAAAVAAGRRVVASEGSQNNELGVPLTCCRLEPDTDVLVAEVGSRGVGHIAMLMPVLRPTIAVVTIVGASHLELLGDVATVARAKTELVLGLDADGVAVLNADDHRVAAMGDVAPGRVVTYGRGRQADWRAEDVTLDGFARPRFAAVGPGDRRVDVTLPLPGEHNVGNALAALAVADLCGVDAQAAAAALASATVSRWRMELLEGPGGLRILNDAYNANPTSTEAALKTLAGMSVAGRRWAVLGTMAELGASSEAAHDRIGRLCIRLGIDGLVVVGQAAAAIRNAADQEGFYGQGDLYLVDSPDEAVALLAPRLRGDDAVLVKASRSVGLERVATALAAGGP
jgi:UDP-N-acetylmuramoyl-tripeptide--D-alanyl-D-alanine ligase